MRFFVSYSRADHRGDKLWLLAERLDGLGEIYIDDIHYPQQVERDVSVHAALESASVFVAVMTRSYLMTPWTRYELARASQLELPLLIFDADTGIRGGTYGSDFGLGCAQLVWARRPAGGRSSVRQAPQAPLEQRWRKSEPASPGS
jgi:hypothetical protein